ncbi:type II secretion system F family protein [Serinicoccus profundi]|uniref:type II secretion system F family protein n=1 Tax=Serinicoccus profundi TaxID=1078471 RepID=UPI000255E451|nr:type II secretion system F family protein [Serinicoccus profundi]
MLSSAAPALAPLLLAALAAASVLVRPRSGAQVAPDGYDVAPSDDGVAATPDTALDQPRRGRAAATRSRRALGRRLLARLGRLRGGRRDPDADLVARELEVVDTIAAALEGGLPVGRAVELALERTRPAVPGAGPDWGIVARAAQEGEPLAPAWERLARRSGTPTVAAVARSWQVAARSGAPLAEALRVSARTARERRRLEDAVQTASAGARATATVLTLLPLAGIGLAAMLGVHPAALYATPLAWACLGAGAALLLLGQVLVRRLIAQVLAGAR